MFHIMVLKDRFEKSTCPAGKTLMIMLVNGLERKKIVFFLFWEDVWVLQGELKIEQWNDKCKNF